MTVTTVFKEEKEEDACTKMSIICPFVEDNGKQDCQGCVFKIHTVRELQEAILSYYKGN